MNSPAPAHSNRPGWERWALVGGALVLLLFLALAAAWWMKTRSAADDAEQRTRLLALLERQRTLSEQLAQIKPAAPPDCPPGQSLRPIGTATAPLTATPPLTGSPPGIGLPASGAATAPPTAGSAPTAALPALPTTGEATVLAGAALAQRLEQATAIVLVAGENDLGTGTGFFIAPNLLVTNRHVVEQSSGRRLFVTSRALGSLRRASVLHVTRGSDPGSPDFALLRLDEGSAPGTLDMAMEISKLASVVAAGFPGVVLQNDSAFRRLMRGEASAAPDLNLTSGAVQSLQSGASGMPLIVHTASIAKGNSGGPLVDGCGRVVGINTFINVDQSQSAKINYAIRSEVMATFLQGAGASARADNRPCITKG